MNRKDGSKASKNGKKIRALKLYLVAYIATVMTLLAPQTPTHSPKVKAQAEQPSITPRDYAYNTAKSVYGWGKSEHKCLGMLWGKESAWNFNAKSPTDDYGIPQRHMRNNTQEQIADFMKSPFEQIDWGLNYIKVRYSSPCQAWQFWQEKRWY
jgi:hypothetical protein